MKRLWYCYVLISMTLSTCQSPMADPEGADDYFPLSSHLLSGVVNKYYYHVNPGEGKDTYTDIFYKSYQVVRPGELLVKNYNAGLEHTRTRRFRWRDSTMLLTQEITYALTDTVSTAVEQPVFLSWKDTTGLLLKRHYTFPEGRQRITERQIAVRDTTVLDRPAKVFEKTYSYFTVYRGDTSEADWTYEMVYAPDFGLWASRDRDYPDGETWTELVEQMPRAEFERRAAHGLHRVAYIDPARTLDDNSEFQLCGPEKTIADYYNGVPDGRFAEGKRAMLNRIFAQVDTTQLGSESGYLTFRFVVNCRGEAGRFTTEQADLDFHARQYDPLLGRFMSLDPMNQFASGYVGMGNMPTMMVDPDGEFAWLIPVAIGAAVNVATNWGTISEAGNFWQGLGTAAQFAGVGALQGASTLLGPAGFALGGAIGGIGNTAIQGGSGSQIIQNGLVGAISGYAGGVAGTAAVSGLGSLASPVLDGLVKGAVGGAAGGFVGGGIASELMGGNFIDGALQGAWQGAALGATTGAAARAWQARRDGFNPLTGKPLQSRTDAYTLESLQSRGISNADPTNPLENTTYTQKVLDQMQLDDYHSFPRGVDAFGGYGKQTPLIGGDKVIRINLEIPGYWRGREGNFNYIIEPNKTVNHRLFVPKR